MDLILWRHADAQNAAEPGDVAEPGDAADLARALTPKGERQARRMAEWLNSFLPDATRILVSPALRAQQTADALGRKFSTREELGPQGSAQALLSLARWPERRDPVLVVGHQPTLGQTAAWLMGRARVDPAVEAEGEPWEGSPWAIRKGGVWWLRHQERHGQARVLLMSVRSPDQF